MAMSGQEAEQYAERYLVRRGLKTLLRNYRCTRGEIDLVMVERLKKRCLICIEVRYRKSRRYGGAVASISAAKRRRLEFAALHLKGNLPQMGLARFESLPLRFDVVGIDGTPGGLEMTWLRGAFECSGTSG